VLTIIVGNIAAVMQDNLKRMLAYSSIAHSGYILIGLLAAGFGGNFKWGASGVMFYLFSYALMTLGSFALVALLEEHEDTKVTVQNLKGLAHHHPLIALSLSVLMLSLAGIPPTIGFFAKFYIFSAAIEQDMYWLVFWGVIGSVISVYYYLRPVVYMYMSEVGEDTRIKVAHYQTRIALVASAVLILVLGIFSSTILQVVQKSVENMF
jgi:NADH-quinone oxidoreductase subunit N